MEPKRYFSWRKKGHQAIGAPTISVKKYWHEIIVPYPQELHHELQGLSEASEGLKARGLVEDAGALGLVANSLQRLHASQLRDEDEDGAAAEGEEAEEEAEEEVSWETETFCQYDCLSSFPK